MSLERRLIMIESSLRKLLKDLIAENSSLYESKDRLIDKLDLSDSQKKEMKAFFNKRPALEKQLDWNKPKEITWKSFEKVKDGVTEPIDPDTVPEFSDKRDEGRGVVSYAVDDSKKGQAAVRKVVDTHFGPNSNPWCLISRKDMAWEWWKHEYNALQKRIAFKKGKLFAFMGSKKFKFDGSNTDDLITVIKILENKYDMPIKDDESFQSYVKRVESETGINVKEMFKKPIEIWWDRKNSPHTSLDEIK